MEKSFIDLWYDGEYHTRTMYNGILCTCCEECDGCAEDLYTE